ncbi:MAG: hypothetical protein PHX33_03295, partial [Candidatus Cloacimonetes bacterium]|nr:hypothetical protein [Candidatus Cloacimonadota bacterium]
MLELISFVAFFTIDIPWFLSFSCIGMDNVKENLLFGTCGRLLVRSWRPFENRRYGDRLHSRALIVAPSAEVGGAC